MKKTKKELSDLELTAMLIQYLVEIDEFPDTWKDFETPEERLRLKQEFLSLRYLRLLNSWNECKKKI